jgi:hypothetical protein
MSVAAFSPHSLQFGPGWLVVVDDVAMERAVLWIWKFWDFICVPPLRWWQIIKLILRHSIIFPPPVEINVAIKATFPFRK